MIQHNYELYLALMKQNIEYNFFPTCSLCTLFFQCSWKGKQHDVHVPQPQIYILLENIIRDRISERAMLFIVHFNVEHKWFLTRLDQVQQRLP